ncbi:hypothetical protein D3C85_1761410 [compost metagenome]
MAEVTVSLATLTIESSDEPIGIDTEPSTPTPRLAELSVFFSAYLSCRALANTVAWCSVVPSSVQTTLKLISMWFSPVCWKLLCPLTSFGSLLVMI